MASPQSLASSPPQDLGTQQTHPVLESPTIQEHQHQQVAHVDSPIADHNQQMHVNRGLGESPLDHSQIMHVEATQAMISKDGTGMLCALVFCMLLLCGYIYFNIFHQNNLKAASNFVCVSGKFHFVRCILFVNSFIDWICLIIPGQHPMESPRPPMESPVSDGQVPVSFPQCTSPHQEVIIGSKPVPTSPQEEAMVRVPASPAEEELVMRGGIPTSPTQELMWARGISTSTTTQKEYIRSLPTSPDVMGKHGMTCPYPCSKYELRGIYCCGIL